MYSHIPVPINGSVELRYEAASTASTGTVYLSEVIKNPNAAFNDAFFYVHLVSKVVILCCVDVLVQKLVSSLYIFQAQSFLKSFCEFICGETLIITQQFCK